MEQLYQVRRSGKFRFGSKLEQRLTKQVGQCVVDFNLLEEGDRVMVCVSGGKDSYALVDLMILQQRRAPVKFELIAVNVDQGWPGFDTTTIARHLDTRDIQVHMVTADYARIVEEKLNPGQTPCALCSRFRRGFLYRLARELECTKIALGHHLDDLLETLLLNLFFAGRLGSMPPRLAAEDGTNVVIRPMAYVEEADLIAYAESRAYPVVRCGCPSCGLPEQQRQVTKRMLGDLEAQHPGLKRRMMAGMANVQPQSLLDRGLLGRLLPGDSGATIGTLEGCADRDEVRLRKLQDAILHRGRSSVPQDSQDPLQDLRGDHHAARPGGAPRF